MKIYLHVQLLEFLLLARFSRRSFWRTVQSIQLYGSTNSGSTEWNWRDRQTESPENFAIIFEIVPIDKEWKSNEITYWRFWASCGDRNATLQVDFSAHPLHLNSNSSTVPFSFTEQNSNSVSFSQSQCCRLLKLLLTRFLSEVDVVEGEAVYHKFGAHHY